MNKNLVIEKMVADSKAIYASEVRNGLAIIARDEVAYIDWFEAFDIREIELAHDVRYFTYTSPNGMRIWIISEERYIPDEIFPLNGRDWERL